MKVLYQQLGLDPVRVDAVCERLDGLAAVVVGDLSCVQRGAWLLDQCGGAALKALRARLADRSIPLLLQLPLVIKESELADTEGLVETWDWGFDGYVTGDPGLVAWLDERQGGPGAGGKKLIYTSNVVNSSFSTWLRERFGLWRIRPLMHRRTFVEEPVGFPKDVVIYGNMLLSCSTFCVQSGDLPTRCRLSCGAPRALTMEGQGETVSLLGRGLFTRRRLDLRPRLGHIADLASVTLCDLDLGLEELQRVHASVVTRSAPGPAFPG